MQYGAIFGAFAVLIAVIVYLDHDRTGWIQDSQAARTGLAVANASIENERRIQTLVKAHQGTLTALTRQFDEDRIGWANERALLSGKLERQAVEAPKMYGDDFDVQLRRIMCEAAAGSDNDAIKACGVRAAAAGPAPIALTLTITREEAERRIETCEAYELGEETPEEIQARYPLSREDACNWSVTGFTFRGGENFLQYFQNLVAYSRELRQHAESRGKIIDIITGSEDDGIRGAAPKKVER